MAAQWVDAFHPLEQATDLLSNGRDAQQGNDGGVVEAEIRARVRQAATEGWIQRKVMGLLRRLGKGQEKRTRARHGSWQCADGRCGGCEVNLHL